MIRILHTADWQIGKPFGGFSGDLPGELRAERFRAVERIAALATARRCDAVLVAGDAFDDNTVKPRDLRRTLEALAGFDGPWVFLPGNHDAGLEVSVWSLLRQMEDRPPNILIADKPEPIILARERLAVLPAPLTRRHEGADVTGWFDTADTPEGTVRVGLAHGSIANRLPEKAESANPIADDRAVRARLDYLALGDWHGFLEIAPRTFYSGTPEPDRHRANEPGHVAYVEIDAPGASPRVEKIRVGRYEWLSLALHLYGDCAAVEEALARIERPRDTLLLLDLAGSLPLRERVRLGEIVEGWAPRLADLRLRDRDLVDEPDSEDMDRIDLAGFVRDAVEELRRKAADPSDPERAAAALALRLAYAEHRRLQGGA
ncbi:metallophosphoesterase family protein [Aureimonas populi]|uniref:Exonuclease SbcCD subunit D n=1 Tax=Aureimonas populi TaxID=1701758 RepID=A0ABW5CFD7_9HYPH|nr:DNA repair exonuclease [Aureimonas populi]